MPFGGEAFEEFVGEYFRYMPQYKGYVVNVHVDYKRDKELQRIVKGRNATVKQAYWSDIDVLAIKGDRAIIVSCDENCGKKLNKILEELRFAEEFVKKEYSVKFVKKVYAFCIAWYPREEDKLKQLQSQNIQILTFTDMVRTFLKEFCKREKIGKTGGKFTEPIMWALREVYTIRVLTEEDPFPVEEARKQRNIKKRRKIIVKWS